MEVCSTCFQATVAECSETITLALGLAADTDYTWKITDGFGSTYTDDVTSNGTGQIEIDADELPDGFLSPSQATFKIEVFTSAGLIQAFTINEIDYTCIQVDVTAGEGLSTIPDPNDSVSAAPDPSEDYLVLD